MPAPCQGGPCGRRGPATAPASLLWAVRTRRGLAGPYHPRTRCCWCARAGNGPVSAADGRSAEAVRPTGPSRSGDAAPSSACGPALPASPRDGAVASSAGMSDSGHSQPGLYGPERRRRWPRDKELGLPGGPQSLSGPGRDRDFTPWDRERRVSVAGEGGMGGRGPTLKSDHPPCQQDPPEETPGTVMQKTPIILAKPPAERVRTRGRDTWVPAGSGRRLGAGG